MDARSGSPNRPPSREEKAAGKLLLPTRTSMARTSGTNPVCLVQPNKQGKPNKPIKRDVRPGGVREDGGAHVRDRTDHG